MLLKIKHLFLKKNYCAENRKKKMLGTIQ